MNRCREDIIKFKQHCYKNIKYELENMIAYSDIGKVKKKQEDSILIAKHPKYEYMKLLALSDGMGGLEDGDIASNFVLKELLFWFDNINIDNVNDIYKQIYSLLMEINDKVEIKCNGGATLVLSLILKNKTIIGNIGDSRSYITKDNELKQIGFDHSIVWNYYAWGKIKNKDDIRFHKSNNQIYNALGGNLDFGLNCNIIDNNDYDEIYLFSDGITDCLSEKDIISLINSDSDNIAELIVNKSLNSISKQDYLDKREYYDVITGGKDNTSAVVLKKIIGVNKK